MNPLLSRVLSKIKPSPKEIARQQEFARALMRKIKKENAHVNVVLAGSLARNTHLKGANDIDIFILFASGTPPAKFEKEGLRIGEAVFKGKPYEKAYSQHPYIRGELEGFRVEIVPCYEIENPQLLQSAVDRTPFHTQYLANKLSEPQKDEVRLLKAFLKGMDAYGAELRTRSMPGYLTELLIVEYGSFESALQTIANWKKNQFILLDKTLSAASISKKFDCPLIVVDPVDPSRNVASAVSLNQMARMVAAARAFLKKPGEQFFFSHHRPRLSLSQVKSMLKKEELLAVELKYPASEIADTVWGQLKRLTKRLSRALEENDFTLIRASEWTDESKRVLLVFELESLTLQKSRKKTGPEVFETEHGERFLAANPKPLSGPRIEEGRWVLETTRTHTQAGTFITQFLQKIKKEEKDSLPAKSGQKIKIISEKQLIADYHKDPAFRQFFSDYLRGKEVFL
ncbi:MAG: CCA tRNA nucleotidyltransferase, partial [Candidatus Diapherotrites archaeon]|nr:CCA tRNA nucleotidyltransferase [Candidatus Diapherotrites archaeon]